MSSFSFKNIATLMTGTMLSQIIPIALSPVLTRLYTPGEFGAMGLYLALSTLFSLIATGRYEMAIHLAKTKRAAEEILMLSFMCTLVFSICLCLILICVSFFIDYPGYFWMLPISTLLGGWYKGISYWLNRKEQFKEVARNRVISSICNALFTLLAFQLQAFGLIGGIVIGQLYNVLNFSSDIKPLFFKTNWRRMLYQAKKYREFPQYLIAGHALNQLSSSMPTYFLTASFGLDLVGQFSLAQRTLSLPISLIAGAVGDVFRQRASSEFNQHGECRALYKKMLMLLFLGSIIPCIFIFFFVQDLFIFVFGANWDIAGKIAEILVWMTFFQFMSNPLAHMFTIAQKLKWDLAWQMLLFMTTGLSLIVGGYMLHHFIGSIYLFAIAYSCMYIFSLGLSYRFALGK